MQSNLGTSGTVPSPFSASGNNVQQRPGALILFALVHHIRRLDLAIRDLTPNNIANSQTGLTPADATRGSTLRRALLDLASFSERLTKSLSNLRKIALASNSLANAVKTFQTQASHLARDLSPLVKCLPADISQTGEQVCRTSLALASELRLVLEKSDVDALCGQLACFEDDTRRALTFIAALRFTFDSEMGSETSNGRKSRAPVHDSSTATSASNAAAVVEAVDKLSDAYRQLTEVLDEFIEFTIPRLAQERQRSNESRLLVSILGAIFALVIVCTLGFTWPRVPFSRSFGPARVREDVSNALLLFSLLTTIASSTTLLVTSRIRHDAFHVPMEKLTFPIASFLGPLPFYALALALATYFVAILVLTRIGEPISVIITGFGTAYVFSIFLGGLSLAFFIRDGTLLRLEPLWRKVWPGARSEEDEKNLRGERRRIHDDDDSTVPGNGV